MLISVKIINFSWVNFKPISTQIYIVIDYEKNFCLYRDMSLTGTLAMTFSNELVKLFLILPKAAAPTLARRFSNKLNYNNTRIVN